MSHDGVRGRVLAIANVGKITEGGGSLTARPAGSVVRRPNAWCSSEVTRGQMPGRMAGLVFEHRLPLRTDILRRRAACSEAAA